MTLKTQSLCWIVRCTLFGLCLGLLGGCSGRYFHAVAESPPTARFSLSEWPYSEYWTGIIFNGQRIGFTHLRIVRGDNPGEYVIHSEAALHFRLLGMSKEVALRAEDVVGPDLSLRRFHYEQQMDGSRQSVDGRVEGERLVVEVEQKGVRHAREYPLEGRVYPTSVITLYPLYHGLQLGADYRYTVFDGELQTLATVEQAVQGYETSELFAGPAFRLRSALHGQTTSTWLDVRGLPQFEMSMGGVFISALEPERRARRYLAEGALNKSESLLAFSRVPTDRPIERPREVAALQLALEGVPASVELPSDGWQQCRREGGEVRCRIGQTAGTQAGEGEVAAYLRPSLTVPSVDARIRRQAEAITAGAASPGERVRHILDWLEANIRKEGVDVFSALDVLEQGRAECQGHSYLYAALARAVGIPTRVVNGLVYSELGPGLLYHTWTESWLEGRWQVIDPTFGQFRADATHLKLVEGEQMAELAPLIPLIGRLKARIIALEFRAQE